MYFKKFPFALQTIFSLHNFEEDNFFQPNTACEQFFTKKVPPPIKNNGPSIKFQGLCFLTHFSIWGGGGGGGTESKLNDQTSLVLDQSYLGVTANVN